MILRLELAKAYPRSSAPWYSLVSSLNSGLWDWICFLISSGDSALGTWSSHLNGLNSHHTLQNSFSPPPCPCWTSFSQSSRGAGCTCHQPDDAMPMNKFDFGVEEGGLCFQYHQVVFPVWQCRFVLQELIKSGTIGYRQLLYRHKIVNDLFTGGESVSAGTFGKAFPVLRSQPVSNYSSHFDMGASVRILQRNRSRKRHEYTYVCIRAWDRGVEKLGPTLWSAQASLKPVWQMSRPETQPGAWACYPWVGLVLSQGNLRFCP